MTPETKTEARERMPCVACGQPVEDGQAEPWPGHATDCSLVAEWRAESASEASLTAALSTLRSQIAEVTKERDSARAELLATCEANAQFVAALAASEEKARGMAVENVKLRAEIGRWSDYSHERGMRTVDLLESLYASLDINALVDKFLCWPLPDTVNPDGLYPAGRTREKFGEPHRLIGTNLLSAIEARQMISYLLAEAPSWLVEKITHAALSSSPAPRVGAESETAVESPEQIGQCQCGAPIYTRVGFCGWCGR